MKVKIEGRRLPPAPRGIEKGSSLAGWLGDEAIDCLAHNVSLTFPRFPSAEFRRKALNGLETLSIMQRGPHLAQALRDCLPAKYEEAVGILIGSLTPPLIEAGNAGSGGFFYLPHTSFVAAYGVEAIDRENEEAFEISMRALYEFTRRFTSEFSIRPFLIRYPDRTLARLLEWTRDPDPHVRRLCSEGSRPRLPWAGRIPAFVKDPRPTLPLLEALKDDPDEYVRRSVANHMGDILKDHPELAFSLCARWLEGASAERKWLIRHAVRLPAKKGVKAALALRKQAR
jgi:3-methyladenine DNA glycosylase AlkC